MKVLVLATIALAVAIGPAKAQIPNSGQMGVPNSPPPIPATVKLFTVKPTDTQTEWTCDQGRGSIQSLSAVHVADEKNASVVLLDEKKQPILENQTPISAYGFRFE